MRSKCKQLYFYKYRYLQRDWIQ